MNPLNLLLKPFIWWKVGHEVRASPLFAEASHIGSALSKQYVTPNYSNKGFSFALTVRVEGLKKIC